VSVERYLSAVETVLTSRKLDREFVLEKMSNELCLFTPTPRGMGLTRTVWALTIPTLCERRLVESAFDVPYGEFRNSAVMWIKDVQFVFGRPEPFFVFPAPPSVSHPITIAIGGPSGTGKTSLIKRLKELRVEHVVTSPAYTTRPPRTDEVDGVEYHFRTKEDLEVARFDPRYSDFVEARGDWYWIDPSIRLRNLFEHGDKIHVLSISRRAQFEQARLLFPKLHWILLFADEAVIQGRLECRGDRDIQRSIVYNQELAAEGVEDLLDLRIDTGIQDVDATTCCVLEYCDGLLRSRWR
jgi:guanylate kinase